MEVLLGSYQGVLTQALTVGALLGVVGGIVLFTVDEADDRLNLIIIGVLAGGLLMFLLQAFSLGDLIDWRNRGLDVEAKQMLYREGGTFWTAMVRVIQGAIAGGLFMFMALAPGRALKGALLGVLLGLVAGFVAWGALRLINAPQLPLVLFGVLVGGIIFFLAELTPTHRA